MVHVPPLKIYIFRLNIRDMRVIDVVIHRWLKLFNTLQFFHVFNHNSILKNISHGIRCFVLYVLITVDSCYTFLYFCLLNLCDCVQSSIPNSLYCKDKIIHSIKQSRRMNRTLVFSTVIIQYWYNILPFYIIEKKTYEQFNMY